MKLKSLMASAALACAGVAASASPIVLSPNPTMPGSFSGDFTQSVDGLFVDDFTFTPSSFSGLVSVMLTSVSGPVSFFVGSLNGQSFGYDPALGATFSFQAQVTADMPLSLTVFGAVLDADGNPAGLGSYLGTITGVAAAVPEPATLALMLVGLVGVGLTRRLARRSV